MFGLLELESLDINASSIDMPNISMLYLNSQI